MKVLKFGGTSVGSIESVRQVLQIVSARHAASEQMAVVVSAFSGATNDLLGMGTAAAQGNQAYLATLEKLRERHHQAVLALVSPENQSSALTHVNALLNELKQILSGVFLLHEASPRALDCVASFGERLSATIVAAGLNSTGTSAAFLDARKLIRTNQVFQNAAVYIPETYSAIQDYFKNNAQLQIITGFIGATKDGVTTTLGRGGSDYTASLFGAALRASAIEIWTDVNGVLTADPRKVPQAFPVRSLTYEEAMELSHFGAKVIYPPTMQPAMELKIPLLIKNTFNPSDPGTLITATRAPHHFLITGVTSISCISLLRVEGSGLVGVAGTAARVFGALADEHINVILISQASSERSICFAIDPGSTPLAKAAIEEAFALEISQGRVDPVVVENDFSVVSVVGEEIRHRAGVAATIFSALGNRGISAAAIAQGSSEMNISIVVAKKDETAALISIHDIFFISKQPIHLFIIGTGLIGSTLLKQLEKEAPRLRKNMRVDIRVVALANTSRMYFAKDGALTDFSKKNLEQGEHFNLTEFIDHIIAVRLPRRVVVDCTASEDVAEQYQTLLAAGVSVVTPNKKANAGSQEHYDTLARLAGHSEARFVYDTNVGAGLPILSTLQDFVRTGDTIISIEGVLSGTLSYLFNTFMTSNVPFSQLVREAKELGFTEPDPREDLSGADVGRKSLILARESGWKIEPADMTVEPVLSTAAQEAKTQDEVWQALAEMDGKLAQKKQQALKRGKVLRYVAQVTEGKVQATLLEVGPEHPAYHTAGAENIFIITTERYRAMPLVIKGPGAGAEVTAAGLLSDIIRLAY